MKKVVGFLARPHGYEVLKTLIYSKEYKLIQVYTHALKPRSQDPFRTEREDHVLFLKICSENNIPLIDIDTKAAEFVNFPTCDFIVEVSWRYLIPKSITKKAQICAFGIHRGKLPDFTGAEPIKQALLKNEQNIVLSAHYLDNIIDKGTVITTLTHPVNYQKDHNLEQNIQRLREEITPLFSKLTLKTFSILSNSTSTNKNDK